MLGSSVLIFDRLPMTPAATLDRDSPRRTFGGEIRSNSHQKPIAFGGTRRAMVELWALPTWIGSGLGQIGEYWSAIG